jgi:hypothetical protein
VSRYSAVMGESFVVAFNWDVIGEVAYSADFFFDICFVVVEYGACVCDETDRNFVDHVWVDELDVQAMFYGVGVNVRKAFAGEPKALVRC